MISPKALQVMREIDKLDRIGLDGVCAMLGEGLRDSSGAWNKGLGLDRYQIEMIRYFFSERTNCVEEVSDRLSRLLLCYARLDVMATLEDRAIDETGLTAWDVLLGMRENEDETWNSNGRPSLSLALDDIIEFFSVTRN